MDIEEIFINNNFIKSKETIKIKEYYSPSQNIYIYNPPHKESISIVIDPISANNYDLSQYTHKIYHSSNMNQFPMRLNKGRSKIHYGIQISLASLEELSECLKMLNGASSSENYLETKVYDTEGKKYLIYTTKYERNPKNRKQAIDIHGTKCQVCGFDFEKVYGDLGNGYIEVHHKVPLYSLDEEIEINPETDLCCLCSNCHRMIHHRRNQIITMDELKTIVNSRNSSGEKE